VIGEGALAQAAGLRAASLVFAAVVAAVAAVALALLVRTQARPERVALRGTPRSVPRPHRHLISPRDVSVTDSPPN
jgi:hypothetical protein